MAFNIETYYSDLFNSLLSANSNLSVSKNFHAQVKAVDTLLKNDKTAMVSTIVDFMVQSANVPVAFESKNSTLNNIFSSWQEDLNADINRDIPRGFRSFSEQYFRERWKSSFIVLNIEWGKIDGYEMPVRMWFSEGGSIYVERKNDNLKDTKYYLRGISDENELKNTASKSYIIRKPYNSWYDKYPTPYLVKKGTLYHSLFKETILNKQSQGLLQAFPALMAIKMGSDEAMRRDAMPSPQELLEMKQKFIDLKTATEDRTANNGLVGAFPYDVNFDNLLPDFQKILDEKLTVASDRNLLMSLGLVEFKGFTSTREEAVLNPKPLVSEIEDALADYVELIDDVVYEIKKRNSSAKKFSTKDIIISVDPIESLLTDKMRDLIRSLYDRGVISKDTVVNSLTHFDFESEVEKRKKERKDNLESIMYAPVILNQDSNALSDVNPEENVEKTPQAVVASEKFKGKKKELFWKEYVQCKLNCIDLDYDIDFTELTAIEWATKQATELKRKYKKS